MVNQRPNILFLLTDQQRWDGLGVHNPAILTPNLDRLACRGTVFSEAVCQAPMCVPSRYSIMKGLYPSQIGVLHNAQSIQDARAFSVPTVARYLRSAGYHTIHSGKAHWFQRANEARGIAPSHSTDFGFDRRYVGKHANDVEAAMGDRAWALEDPEAFAAFQDLDTRASDPFLVGGEGPVGYAGGPYPLNPERTRESWFTSAAIQSLSEAPANQPWFVHLSLDAPHAPLFAPKEFIDLYDINAIPDTPLPPPGTRLAQHAPMPENARLAAEAWKSLPPLERRRYTLHYFAFCSFMDAQFGRLIDAVERRGELENTFILFASDHGESLGDRFRFSKYSFYEASVRVPLFISGAGLRAEQRGSTDARAAELVDILPTLLDAAGIERPPFLVGESLLQPSERAGAFSEYHGIGCEPEPVLPAYMWRTSEWKLILHSMNAPGDVPAPADITGGELYNLRADPHEWTDLYDEAAFRDVRDSLTTSLCDRLAWARALQPGSPASTGMA